MDAFYASVEQLDFPAHRGRPVVVGADPKDGKGRGVVAACSYEARAFGIHSALPIARAWRMCPEAVFLRPRFDRYAQVSTQVFTVLRRYTDLVEPLSIDEAFLDVTGSARLFGEAEAIGRDLKGAIRAELGLVASVGVAPNKFVAKIASDLEKPDGFVTVVRDEVEAFLAPLPLTRLWGVGPKTAERLKRAGLRTIGDVARLGRANLEAMLGEAGAHFWALSRGEDDRVVVPESEAKSIGAETTFAEDVGDPALVQRTLLVLADRAAGRLRRHGLQAGGVTLKFRDAAFHTVTRATVLAHPTDLGEDLHRAAQALLEGISWRGRKVRLVGVTATRLAPAGSRPVQADLFAADDDRRRRLARTVDSLRERFGERALTRAALLADGEEPEGEAGVP
jgi:DNA polymerase-4